MVETKVSFEIAVINLGKADFNEVFAAVHQMHTAVAKMDDSEVVAAYYTIQTCCVIKKELNNNAVVIGLKEAIVAQMRHLSYCQLDLQKRFRAVTGREF